MDHILIPNAPSAMPLDQSGAWRKRFDGLFPYALLAIAIGALVRAVVLGISEDIGRDGSLHLFISQQSTWGLFLDRWREDAHPILYYLVLRAVALFVHSNLIYRAPSIVSGAASIYLLGLIAARQCSNKAVALLTAAAYGFSSVMQEINIDVRSYPLALFLVIAASYYLVDFLDREIPRNRSLLLFGIFTTLAIASEYCAILFLFACLGTFALLLAARPIVRRRLMDWARRNRHVPITAFGLPFAAIACLYLTHMKFLPAVPYSEMSRLKFPLTLPPAFAHISGFYWSPGSSRIDFVLRNWARDLNYMLPIEISSKAVTSGILAVFPPLLLYRGLFQKKPCESFAAGVPGLLLLMLLAQLIILSLLRLYPFGGFERHQSILFPFFTLTAFLLLDGFIESMRPFVSTAFRLFSGNRRKLLAWLTAGVLAMAAAFIAVNLYSNIHAHIRRLLDSAKTVADTRPRAAIDFLEQAGRLHPNKEEREEMALLYQRLNEFDRALIILNSLVTENGGQARWICDRGVLEFLMDNRADAVKDLRTAIVWEPGYLPPYLNLGALYASSGQRVEALHVYEMALGQMSSSAPDDLSRLIRAEYEKIHSASSSR